MSDDLFTALRALHHNAPSMRCGARSAEGVEHYSGRYEEASALVCTLEPGHDGPHQDAICCWRFHRFEGGAPAPEDVWRGRSCSCGVNDCPTRALLDAEEAAR